MILSVRFNYGDFTVSNEQSVQPIYTKIPCKISLNYQVTGGFIINKPNKSAY